MIRGVIRFLYTSFFFSSYITNCLLVEGRQPANNLDFDLDPMTMILNIALDALKIHLRAKNEGCLLRQPEQDRHTETNRRDRTHYHAAFTSDKTGNKHYMVNTGVVIVAVINSFDNASS